MLMVSPLTALDNAVRSEPGPLSAPVVTVKTVASAGFADRSAAVAVLASSDARAAHGRLRNFAIAVPSNVQSALVSGVALLGLFPKN